MKNYLKALIVGMFIFSFAAACEKDTLEDEIIQIEATDGDEVKRPGGGNNG